MQRLTDLLRALFGAILGVVTIVVASAVLAYIVAMIIVTGICLIFLAAPILYIVICTFVGALPFGQKLLPLMLLSLLAAVVAIAGTIFFYPLLEYEGDNVLLQLFRHFFAFLAVIPLIFMFVPIGNGIVLMFCVEAFALALLLLGGEPAGPHVTFGRKFITSFAIPVIVLLLLLGGLQEVERKHNVLGERVARHALRDGKVPLLANLFPSTINRTNGEEVEIPPGGEHTFTTQEPRATFNVHTPDGMYSYITLDVEYADGKLDVRKPADFFANLPRTPLDHYRMVRSITVHNHSNMPFRAYDWWVPSS